MPIKIVHCADLHLGAAHSSLGNKGPRREAEVLNALYSAVVCCREQKADILLIAGDLFDNPCPAEPTLDCAIEYLTDLTDTEVFIVAGNHDYLTPSSPYMKDWGENIHIFRENDCLEFDSYRIFGISFFEPFSNGFTLPKAPDDGKINILLMHGDIFGGPYNPLTEQKISETGMDYVALGHVHAPSGVRYAGRVPYAYPGSIEPLGFDEIGERGVLAGTVLKGTAELDFVRICRRVCREITVDAGPFSENRELESHLQELLSPFENDMVKIILSGESVFSPNSALLKTALEDKVFHLRIKDRTYPKENLELLRNEQTLKGIFTNKMLTVIENSEGEQKLAAERALRLGLAAFMGREVGLLED